jgi:hypothetical protein
MRISNLAWLSAAFSAGVLLTTGLLLLFVAAPGTMQNRYAVLLSQHLREPIVFEFAVRDERLWLASCRYLAGSSGLTAKQLGAGAFDLHSALRRDIEAAVVRDAWVRLSMLEKVRSSTYGPDDAQIARANQLYSKLRGVTQPARTLAQMILPCGARTDIDVPSGSDHGRVGQ